MYLKQCNNGKMVEHLVHSKHSIYGPDSEKSRNARVSKTTPA